MHKILSRSDLERIGSNVINQYYMVSPRVGTMPARVDPIAVAKTVLGLETSFLPLSRDGSILGLSCFQDMTLVVEHRNGAVYEVHLTDRDIVVDISLRDPAMSARRNFTAAHELGHHILVRLYPQYYRSSRYCRKPLPDDDTGVHRDLDWVEWQANGLAEVILMPAETVRQCVQLFGFRPEMDSQITSGSSRNFECFCEIASFLDVSRKALAIRMKHLGLVGEPFLKNYRIL